MHIRHAILSIAVAAVLSAPFQPVAAEATFAIDDVEVCGARAAVNDPEFDIESRQMAYIDADGRLRIVTLGPTGLPPIGGCGGAIVDTRAVLVPRGLSAIPNGPEWGRSRRGAEVYYTRRDDAGRSALARAWHDGTAWRREALAGGEDRGSAIASVDRNDAQPRLLYAVLAADGTSRPAWRESGDPATERQFAAEFPQRWIPGHRALAIVRRDAYGVPQAFRYHVDTGVAEPLTTGPAAKREVYMWQAPEFGGDFVFITVVDGHTLKAFRQTPAGWLEVYSLTAATFSPYHRIWSPEPLVHGGRSYVAMQVADEIGAPGDIWIAAIDLNRPLLRQVTPTDGVRVRIEPEWFVTPSGVYVHYSQYDVTDTLRRPSLRRAAAGL